MAKKPPTQREAFILQLLLEGEKYGLDLRDAYQTASGQRMPLGSLYTSLDRMQQKGFIKSRWGESTGPRGGNRRKYFKTTGLGSKALDRFRARVDAFHRLLALQGRK